ncbi:MAG: hypothetical protein ACLP7P_08440 [Rhodomicrobium sp.]
MSEAAPKPVLRALEERAASLEQAIAVAILGLSTLDELGPVHDYWPGDDYMENVRVRHIRNVREVKRILKGVIEPKRTAST